MFSAAYQAGPAAPSRRFPARYEAALAICSDLDETPDADTYFELMRFLNTSEETSMGPGVGLEVGNSIYFDMPPGHFSYWNTDDQGREKIRALIKSGHIDVLHSYGDLAATRTHAARALEELERNDCHLRVWVDHSKAPTNFGADIMMGHGDEPGHPAYHADLTFAHGIEYVWVGRVTSVIGQNQKVSFQAIGDWGHPIASAKTIAKEAGKQLMGRCGSRKYGMHASNRLTRPVRLRDNLTNTVEFIRCNPHWDGVSSADTGRGISEVLSAQFLRQLSDRGGVCILYTHLGKLNAGMRRFDTAAVKAFRRLAEYYHSGKILVTTTYRLLDLCARGSAGPSAAWQRLPFPAI